MAAMGASRLAGENDAEAVGNQCAWLDIVAWTDGCAARRRGGKRVADIGLKQFQSVTHC
jgi:hypothetical protein